MSSGKIELLQTTITNFVIADPPTRLPLVDGEIAAWFALHNIVFYSGVHADGRAYGFNKKGAAAILGLADALLAERPALRAGTRVAALANALAKALLTSIPLQTDSIVTSVELDLLEDAIDKWFNAETIARRFLVPCAILPEHASKFSVGPVQFFSVSELAEREGVTPEKLTDHLKYGSLIRTMYERDALWLAEVEVSGFDEAILSQLKRAWHIAGTSAKENTMPTLEQIKDKMKKLQEQADKLIAKRAQSVLTEIRKLMEEHGLTTGDIAAHSAATKQRGRTAGSKPTPTATRNVTSHSVVVGVTPPKYRHPKTGATWTGHGRAPAWIAAAKDRSKYLIDGTELSTVSKAKTATKKAVTGGAGAHKGPRKGPQPAKYLNPETGAKWSGRGPAPAWLAATKDRSKFLIADADAVATDTSAASKASKPKSSATGRAVATKVLPRRP